MADIKYIIPFTYKWEGGLTRATTDSASKSPSPYIYKGVSGWHTNKGVTYAAFKSNAPSLGYVDNAQNFLSMPEDIGLKIAKIKYWDILYLDEVKSQAVANVMFSWMWGSGYAWQPRMERYLASKGITWKSGRFQELATRLNEIVAKEGEKKIFDELIEQKKQYLLSLGEKSNPGGVYTKGWLNRLADLQTYSYGLLGKSVEAIKDATKKGVEGVKKKPLTTIVLTTLLIVSGYLIYKYGIKKK